MPDGVPRRGARTPRDPPVGAAGNGPAGGYDRAASWWHGHAAERTSEGRTMTEAVAAPRRSRRAIAAKIAGIVGVVICVAIIVGVWIGRGAIASTVEGLAADVNGAFERAITVTDTVAGRLNEAASSVGSISTEADELSSSASPSSDRVAALQARVAELGDKYRQLRTRYAEVRENVTSAVARLQSVSRFVPGISVPQGAVDALTDFDAKMTELDEALTSTIQGFQDQGGVRGAAAQALADGAAKIEAAISGAASAVDGVTTRLTSAQTQADNAMNGIGTLLLLAALVISILLIWVLLLNVALWLLGRAWQREENEMAGSGGSTVAASSVESVPAEAAPPAAG